MGGFLAKLKEAARRFVRPSLLLLCLGGAIRNGAGIVSAYNLVLFYADYHPEVKVSTTLRSRSENKPASRGFPVKLKYYCKLCLLFQIEEWLSWIPLVFGSLGALSGGHLSDKFAKTRGVTGRLFVLIACLVSVLITMVFSRKISYMYRYIHTLTIGLRFQSLSAPFLVGTLYAPMPWSFVCLIPAYLIGEMWIGVCIAVVVDLVPADLTTSSIAVYVFIIQIIGGNMNLLVTPITDALNLRIAMLITFPGFYVLGALIFFIALLVVRREEAGSKGSYKEAATKDVEERTKNGKYGSTHLLEDTDYPGDSQDTVDSNNTNSRV